MAMDMDMDGSRVLVECVACTFASPHLPFFLRAREGALPYTHQLFRRVHLCTANLHGLLRRAGRR